MSSTPRFRRSSGRPLHTPDRLFFGENWEDGEDFLADCAVDVTDGMEAWRSVLREYALATGLSEFPYFDYYSSLYRLRGCVSGFGYAQFFAAQSSSTMSGVRQFLRGSVDGEQTEERP